MRTLDREELGLRKFWREYKRAIKAKESVRIITHRDDIKSLQKDIKLLLGKSVKGYGKNAVIGLTPEEIFLLLEVLQWLVILALIGSVIYLASKNYKFKVKRNKDGEIEIEGEPR